MDQDQERRLAALAALDLDEAARARLVEELAQIAAQLDRLTAYVEDVVAEGQEGLQGRAGSQDQAPTDAVDVPGQTPPEFRKGAAEA
jgi:hypothetical protein